MPVPRLRPGQALVRVGASAVCGSERSALRQGFAGNAGHEAGGTIVEPGASHFRPGDLVGLSAVVGCDVCDRCREGRELHCRSGPTIATGWHCEYLAVAPSALRTLPVGVDAAMAAMLTGDPLGVPVRALRRAPTGKGDRVVVIGLGPVGLAHVVVRAFEGADVVGVEPARFRRNLGLELGASQVFHAVDDIGFKADVVIECTGIPECIRQAFAIVEDGGVVLQSGECVAEIPLSPTEIFVRREVTYTGSWYYASEDYGAMVDLMGKGLPLERLCTHDVGASQAQEAITEFLNGRTGKVVLRWS
ncbi:zinc-binding dehydrogenase [Saccharomonospora sp. NPDC006951]